MKECKHFNGVQNKTCKAGVTYDKNFSALPCTSNVRRVKTESMACDKFSQITEQMRKKEKEESDKRFKLIMETIALIKEKHGDDKGLSDQIECPKCKGRLGYSISGYNGHIHACCENKCVAFMQ